MLRLGSRLPAPAVATPLLALLCAAPPLPARPQLDSLRALDREPGIEVAAEVRSLDGEELLSYRDRDFFTLASNMKLFTTSAALLELGPGYRWHTEAYWEDGVLRVVGHGDPSLRKTADEDAAADFLDGLAAALRAAGVAKVAELQVDGRAFAPPFVHPDWPRDQLQNDYCAPVSALAVEGNVVELRAGPQGLRATPADGVDFLRLSGRGKSLRATWREDGRLAVSGSLRRPQRARIAVRDPLRFFGRWLRAGLAARGIPCAGLRVLGVEDPPPPAGEAPLYVHESAWTVAEAVMVADRDSDNFVAETLLRTLGAEAGGAGTDARGVARVREALEELGLDPRCLEQADGSGLARDGHHGLNRASAHAICDLLCAMAERPEGRILFDALPAGGVDGRLARRFRDPRFQPRRLRAKTGFIRGTSSLSGYLLATDDRILVFSILFNFEPDGKARTNNARFKAFEEKLLARILSRPSAGD